MKRFIAIITALYFICMFAAIAETKDPGSFRGIPWGSSKESIIDAMGEPMYSWEKIYSNGCEFLTYEDVTVGNFKADAVFFVTLETDELIHGSYLLNCENPWSAFGELSAALTSLYGDPNLDPVTAWLHNANCGEKRTMTFWHALRHMENIAEDSAAWQLGSTEILIIRNGYSLNIYYTGTQYIKTDLPGYNTTGL